MQTTQMPTADQYDNTNPSDRYYLAVEVTREFENAVNAGTDYDLAFEVMLKNCNFTDDGVGHFRDEWADDFITEECVQHILEAYDFA